MRLSRTAQPATALAPWTAVFCAALILLGVGSPSLIALGVPAVVWTSVRRPWCLPCPARLDGSTYEYRIRSVPPAQARTKARGVDTTLLAMAAAGTVPGECPRNAAIGSGWVFCDVRSCPGVLGPQVRPSDQSAGEDPGAASNYAWKYGVLRRLNCVCLRMQSPHCGVLQGMEAPRWTACR